MGAIKLSYYDGKANFLSVFSKKETPENFFSASKSAYDYYPFGMLLPNRHESSNEYRYGFNGMEKDDEVAGEGNSYTTLYRQYDSRVGKWLSSDPKESSFPWQSPYVSMDNNPIIFNDPNGDCPTCITAGIGAAVGFIYGAFKYGFSDGGWKKTLAATGAGAVAGLTLGLGTAAVASFGAAGTFTSGAAVIGGANTTYIMGGAAVTSYITGNLTEQGLKIATGDQKGFNEYEFTATLMTALPGALFGGALDKVVPGATQFLTKKMSKELGEELTYQAQKEWIKTTAKTLKENVRVGGHKITSKNAKEAATKMYKMHIETGEETLRQTLYVTKKGVQISTVLVETAASNETTKALNEDSH